MLYFDLESPPTSMSVKDAFKFIQSHPDVVRSAEFPNPVLIAVSGSRRGKHVRTKPAGNFQDNLLDLPLKQK